MTVRFDEGSRINGRFSELHTMFVTPDVEKEHPLLAHYTSVEVMEKILQHEQVWLSNPLFMNDWEEMRFGLIEGGRAIADQQRLLKAGGTQQRARKLEEQFNQFHFKFENEGSFDTYIFCLSDHTRTDDDGLLSMWRGYGGQGRGAAIVFDTSKITFINPSPLIVTKVRYGDVQTRLRDLNRLADKWASITASSAVPDELLHIPAYHALAAVIWYALTTKHSGFSEEREGRLVYMADRDPQGLLKHCLDYQVTANGVEPKLKYAVKHIDGVSHSSLSMPNIIDRIILGPSISSPLAHKGVVRMLEKIGRPEYISRIRASTIPFRPTDRIQSS